MCVVCVLYMAKCGVCEVGMVYMWCARWVCVLCVACMGYVCEVGRMYVWCIWVKCVGCVRWACCICGA